MKGRTKLFELLALIQKEYTNKILNFNIDGDRPYIKISFRSGTILYIHYNDYDEYSYQIAYSQTENDWIRFDNFDAHWPVKTNPHHVHWFGQKIVKESSMNGNPNHDFTFLIRHLKE